MARAFFDPRAIGETLVHEIRRTVTVTETETDNLLSSTTGHRSQGN